MGLAPAIKVFYYSLSLVVPFGVLRCMRLLTQHHGSNQLEVSYMKWLVDIYNPATKGASLIDQLKVSIHSKKLW